MIIRTRHWWALVLLVALGLSPLRAYGQESETITNFVRLWSAAQKAQAAGNYQEAVARYADVATILPFDPSTRYHWACCLVKLGKIDGALDQLQAAIDYGWCYTVALEQDEVWQPLRTDPRLAEKIKAAADCRDETLVVHAAEGVGRDRPAPVLVVLHGLGIGPRSEVPYWKSAADRLGMVLVAPRAGTRFGPLIHGWQRAEARDSSAPDFYDLEAAQERVGAALEEAARRYRIDRSAVVLAGYSQGGGVALGLMANHPERFRGAVVINSLCPPLEKEKWRKVAEHGGARVQIIAGEFDKLLGRSRSAAEVLRTLPLEMRLDVVERAGHEFPHNYSDHLSAALRFVLSGAGDKE
ncbi:MAG TPA: alpha/beta hydrolase-fold protein [Gemmatales bacterium]|nr:alpha/beta hydrolase-fold protein [Gemmatales bacterium]